MKPSRIAEIELSKLQPNSYNPRKTMDKKGLASLEKSLDRDGQLQPILARPIDGNKYEVVAGMRRYLSLKNLGQKKVFCTIQEMDDQTAMQRAFKENMEREALTPVDEGAWYFQMLGLKEEQLYIPRYHAPENICGEPLPTYQNKAVIKLANEIDVKAAIIGQCLPLVALPEDMQRKVGYGEEAEIPFSKALELVRLRLIGKDDAHREIPAIWKLWGQKDLDALREQINIKLDAYAKKAEDVLKELKTLEDNLSKRIEMLGKEMDKVKIWLDPEEKGSLLARLEEEIGNAIADKKLQAEILKDFADEITPKKDEAEKHDEPIWKQIEKLQERITELEIRVTGNPHDTPIN